MAMSSMLSINRRSAHNQRARSGGGHHSQSQKRMKNHRAPPKKQIIKTLSSSSSSSSSSTMSESPVNIPSPVKNKATLSSSAISSTSPTSSTTVTTRTSDALLLQAAKEGQDAEARYQWIHNGADMNARNQYGSTPLHLAVRYGHHDNEWMAQWMVLMAHADVHAVSDLGWTPLHEATAHGRWTLVCFLLEHGADLHATKRDGKTPLDLLALHLGLPRNDEGSMRTARRILVETCGSHIISDEENKKSTHSQAETTQKKDCILMKVDSFEGNQDVVNATEMKLDKPTTMKDTEKDRDMFGYANYLQDSGVVDTTMASQVVFDTHGPIDLMQQSVVTLQVAANDVHEKAHECFQGDVVDVQIQVLQQQLQDLRADLLLSQQRLTICEAQDMRNGHRMMSCSIALLQVFAWLYVFFCYKGMRQSNMTASTKNKQAKHGEMHIDHQETTRKDVTDKKIVQANDHEEEEIVFVDRPHSTESEKEDANHLNDGLNSTNTKDDDDDDDDDEDALLMAVMVEAAQLRQQIYHYEQQAMLDEQKIHALQLLKDDLEQE